MDGGKQLTECRSRTTWRSLLDSAAQFPDRDALVGADDAGRISRLTYHQLVTRARNLSAGLASIGVRRGDRVVLWMTNRLDWVVASFATQRLGAALVPINTFLKPSEIEYLIGQSGARHLVMLDAFRALDFPGMLADLCPAFKTAQRPGFLHGTSLPDLRNIVILKRGESPGHEGSFDYAALEALGVTSQEALDLADRMAAEVLPSDLAMVKYTSGSTGFPKGVMLEQGGVVANAMLHSRRIGAGETDIFFSMMPFFHGGGSIWGLMTMLVNGGTLVFTEAFNAELAVDLITLEQATILFGVLGEEIIDVAEKRGVTLPSLRIALPLSKDIGRVMPNVASIISPFGLTESYGPAAVTGPADPRGGQGLMCGRVLDGNECRVVDPETGKDVAVGEIGEAWLRGNVMKGYWNKPEETARALDQDGWLHSEDLVSMDADGYIYYRGRLKLMLKVGGENVSLEEVERVVNSHAAVADSCAVGVADARKQEAVRIYVVLRQGWALTEADLRAWLTPKLARFKMPREIVFVAELPRLANGKLDRVSLSRQAQKEVFA